MKRIGTLISSFLVSVTLLTSAYASTGERVKITGEIIDTWCYISEIMGG